MNLLAQSQPSITNPDLNPATNFPDPTYWSISSFLTGCPANNPGCIPTGFNLINLLFFIVGLAFFASLVIASISFISSTGDPTKISKANSRITTSLIGLILVFASFIIVRLVAALFGFEFIVPVPQG